MQHPETEDQWLSESMYHSNCPGCFSHGRVDLTASGCVIFPKITRDQLWLGRAVQHAVRNVTHKPPPDTGRGKLSPEDHFGAENFVRRKFRHTSNFGAGPSDTETSTAPPLGSLWTISCVKLWQAQILLPSAVHLEERLTVSQSVR